VGGTGRLGTRLWRGAKGGRIGSSVIGSTCVAGTDLPTSPAYDDAVATHKKSIALNPNRADSYAFLADTLTFIDRADEAIEAILTAMRLDPYYQLLFDMYLGRAYYFSKQYDKAAAQLRTCIVRAPKFRPCYMFLAPTYAELGNQAEAQRIVETLLKIAPKFSISKSVRDHLPFVPSAMQFYIGGLRKAGVPE
jgi:tetratricopeptide (TPR) repeat protein